MKKLLTIFVIGVATMVFASDLFSCVPTKIVNLTTNIEKELTDKQMSDNKVAFEMDDNYNIYDGKETWKYSFTIKGNLRVYTNENHKNMLITFYNKPLDYKGQKYYQIMVADKKTNIATYLICLKVK